MDFISSAITATGRFVASPATDFWQLTNNLLKPNAQPEKLTVQVQPGQKATRIDNPFDTTVSEETKKDLQVKITLLPRNELPSYYWARITRLVEQVVRLLFCWILPTHKQPAGTIDLSQNEIAEIKAGTLKAGSAITRDNTAYIFSKDPKAEVEKLIKGVEDRFARHENVFAVGNLPAGAALLNDLLLTPAHKVFTLEGSSSAKFVAKTEWYQEQSAYLLKNGNRTGTLTAKPDEANNKLIIDIPADWSTGTVNYIVDNGLLFVRAERISENGETTENQHYLLVEPRIQANQMLTQHGSSAESLELTLLPKPVEAKAAEPKQNETAPAVKK